MEELGGAPRALGRSVIEAMPILPNATPLPARRAQYHSAGFKGSPGHPSWSKYMHFVAIFKVENQLEESFSS